MRGIDPSTLADIREIGRKKVPVPLGVLLVHISEHTQRHVGEAIVTAKIVRVLNRPEAYAGIPAFPRNGS